MLAFFALVSSSIAATVTYDFNVTWVTAQPDGFSRPTIGINGQWPIPPIIATVGDRVVVNVQNQLGNQTTSLHFHGLYMNGTAHMDGPVGVSQCTIPVDGSFVYDFKVSTISLISHNPNLIMVRSTNRAPIGTIRTSRANIRMACVVR